VKKVRETAAKYIGLGRPIFCARQHACIYHS